MSKIFRLLAILLISAVILTATVSGIAFAAGGGQGIIRMVMGSTNKGYAKIKRQSPGEFGPGLERRCGQP